MATDNENNPEHANTTSPTQSPAERALQEKLRETQKREAALREVNQRMEEFLGATSHELRTPLTTIKANIQLAQRRLKPLPGKKSYDPEEVTTKVTAAQDMLMRAERQVEVLNRLVGDMIDISHIQSGKLQMHLQSEPCNLVSIAQEIVREQRKTAPERSILLEIPAREEILIIADPGRIGQAFNHYVDNALKYSEADRPVAVRLQLEKQVVRVSVEDEGPGLAEHEQQRVWECFYQVPAVKVANGSGLGLGLGLYISQTIIAYHSGQVGVHSVPEKGSTFWFTLPIAQQDDGE